MNETVPVSDLAWQSLGTRLSWAAFLLFVFVLLFEVYATQPSAPQNL